MLSNQFAAYI